MRQYETRQDKTRQDKTRQDKTRQDKTRQDKTRQDNPTQPNLIQCTQGTSKKGPGPRIRVIMGSPPTLSTLRFSMIRSIADLLLLINMGWVRKISITVTAKGVRRNLMMVISIMVTVTAIAMVVAVVMS